MEKYSNKKGETFEKFKDKLIKNKGPTFGQLPKRKYEIDYHINH